MLSQQSAPALANANFERPKVLYNAGRRNTSSGHTRKTPAVTTQARAVVATCDTPDGNYKYVKDFRPFGNESRDCTLYKDDDGAAYFISSTRGNSDMVCYKLTDDYLDVKAQSIMLKGSRREAPAVFKRNGRYYLITSACTSWGPNGNMYATARKINDRFGPMKVFCSGKTWNTYCLAVGIRAAGRRHARNDLRLHGRPLEGLEPARFALCVPAHPIPDGRLARARGMGRFLGHQHGHGRMPRPGGVQSLAAEHRPRSTCTASLRNEKDGNEAWAAFDDNPHTRWCAADGDYPHWLKVDLGSTLPVSRSDIAWESSSGRIYKYAY